MDTSRRATRKDLTRIAVQAMLERGLEPDFPAAVQSQLASIRPAGGPADPQVRDLTALPWCSIDNDDSRDLDQLTACEPLADGAMKVLVAIADVDALVGKDTAIDMHARMNTTSVYTSACIFPMLPERLSYDLSSLNQDQDRLALVTEIHLGTDAMVGHSTVYRALVRNKAKLAYDAVSDWLVGKGPLPEPAQVVPGIEAQLRLQDAIAQRLRAHRRNRGALDFETLQPRARFDGDQVVDISQQPHNRARQLIEEIMIATNGCTARFLAQQGGASLRRVVRSPERWQRIVELAAGYDELLPGAPDALALEQFLTRRRAADPLRFADLSLVVVKLMGRGEYVVERPGAVPIGHFGLAVVDYTHSTAPNRRFPDLITLRLLKAILAGGRPAYSPAELDALAVHCTLQEDAAQKVERRMRKSEAAMMLQSRIGQRFDGVVTGRQATDAWVRIFSPPVEGKLAARFANVDVGEVVRVKLIDVDVERGFVDFVQVG